MAVAVRDMTAEDEYYCSTCSHVNESEETDRCGQRRREWLRAMHGQGLRVKVGLVDGERQGLAYCMPVEVSPWGPLGRGLMVLPCLFVQEPGKGRGLGRALVAEAEAEARRQAREGIVIPAFDWDFWFMPAAYFLRLGYEPAPRTGAPASKELLVWKRFSPEATAPEPLVRRYRFAAVPGRVVVDLFYNTFCQTSGVEAERVAEAAAGFGDRVVLNRYCADEREVLLRYRIPRAIFVNGREIGWGYEAPKDLVRAAIADALDRV